MLALTRLLRGVENRQPVHQWIGTKYAMLPRVSNRSSCGRWPPANTLNCQSPSVSIDQLVLRVLSVIWPEKLDAKETLALAEIERTFPIGWALKTANEVAPLP